MYINRLRKLFVFRRTNQKEVSEKVGLSEPAFSAAMKKGDFKVSKLEKISEVLNVNPSYFFLEKEPELSDDMLCVGEEAVEYKKGDKGEVKALKETIKLLREALKKEEDEKEYFRKLYEDSINSQK